MRLNQYNFLKDPTRKATHLIIKKESKSLPTLSQNKKFAEKISANDNLGPMPITHTTQPNDTIDNIGKKYQVKPSHIVYWNQLKYPYDLENKNHLIIWKHQNKDNTYIRYVVKSGDTLSKIAKEHKTNIKRIQNASKIGNITLIKPNQVLTIPQ